MLQDAVVTGGLMSDVNVIETAIGAAAESSSEQTLPRVLLVDDRRDKLIALEAILSGLPIHVVCATSGRDALRALLQDEYAAILLDVNMPGMDGFETASLIRQRKSSEHTPIIFITAMQDDMMASRGYKLGAVDFIPQPVLPDILRTKVMVFVDLYRKNRQLAVQAELHRRRADQLQKLAAAAVSINAALSMEKMLQIITDAARDIIGTHQAITLFILDNGDNHHSPQVEAITSFSEKYEEWKTRRLQMDICARTLVANRRAVTRMTNEELYKHPDWDMVKDLQMPPIHGVLAMPMYDRSGQNLGVIYLSEKIDGEFSGDDEALLIQLAHMASTAIDNAISAGAREASRAKDQFLAVLSHELRTPLTPVLAVLQQVHRDERIPSDTAEDLSLALRNVELEARLIDDLLDLTRINKGKIELHLEIVDLHSLLRETLKICQADFTARDLHVKLEFADKAFMIRADLTRMQQVLWNLLKNAVKFTPRGGSITIRTSNAADGKVQVEVTDTGIGIEADMLPRIFGAFEQGRRHITRQFGGLGLGLAIAKALVTQHHGDLTAQSAGKDKGATFTLTLPMETSIRAIKHTPVPQIINRSADRSLRILLVEDHADTARVMMKILMASGHTVTQANCVADALQLAGEREFDLLISDIGLPDGTGLDLMRSLRNTIQGIALSGFGMEEDIRKSKEAGFAEHITKPLNLRVLIDTIDRVTSSAAVS